MAIAIKCDGCGKQYKVEDRFAGKRAKCKACGKPIAIPAPSPAEPDDVFAAMDELERTGKVDDEQTYGLAEPPPAPRAAAASHVVRVATANYPGVARRTPAAAPPKSVARSMIWFIIGPPGVNLGLFVVLVVLCLLALTSAKAAVVMGGPLLITAFAITVIGSWWSRIVARSNGFTILHGLIPGYNIIFAMRNWDTMAAPVFCMVRGLALLLLAGAVCARAGKSPFDNHRSHQSGLLSRSERSSDRAGFSLGSILSPVSETVVGPNTGLQVGGMGRPLFVSPDWSKIAVLYSLPDTRMQLAVDGVQGPAFGGINPRSIGWSPDSSHVAYEARNGEEHLLVIGNRLIHNLAGAYTLAMSSDGAHEAVLLYRTVPPTNKPALVLILDGRERQLKQGKIDGLRFTNDGRLFYKLSGTWYGNDDRPAGDTVLAELNSPLPPVAPPAATHRITTQVERTGFQQRATTIYVDGKSVGTYDEVLQRRGPTGPQSYHVLPDGSAILYAFRGGAIVRIVVR